MTLLPCAERRFTLKLDKTYLELFGGYLHWYRSLLVRLGPDATHRLWREALTSETDPELERILAAGWSSITHEATQNIESKLTEALEKHFAQPVTSVTGATARELVEATPPLVQLRAAFSDLAVQKELGTYDALHIMRHNLARLAEALLDEYGKAGELIAYDILLEEIRLADFKPVTVEEFIAQRKARFSETPKEMDMHSAGLDMELITVTDTEIVSHITHCEWARYFRERHPRVGYLLFCSCDNAAYRAMNSSLRLQRTTTLMEGGDKCDFRIHAAAAIEG